MLTSEDSADVAWGESPRPPLSLAAVAAPRWGATGVALANSSSEGVLDCCVSFLQLHHPSWPCVQLRQPLGSGWSEGVDQLEDERVSQPSSPRQGFADVGVGGGDDHPSPEWFHADVSRPQEPEDELDHPLLPPAAFALGSGGAGGLGEMDFAMPRMELRMVSTAASNVRPVALF
jgi:hypothetical protein